MHVQYEMIPGRDKKSLVLEPGTSNFSTRTSIYFHPMSDGQVKIYSARLYYLECPVLFGNRASKNLGVLVRRTSDHFEIFLPCSGFIEEVQSVDADTGRIPLA